MFRFALIVAWLVGLVVLVCPSPEAAQAQVLDPVAWGSVSSSGDVSSTGWIYDTSVEKRAIIEYDISGFAGSTISTAVLGGTIYVNNSADTGDRIIQLGLYSGDGLVSVADYDPSRANVGSVSYHPPIDSNVSFSFDIASQIRAMLSSGSDYAGINFTPMNFQAPSLLSSGDYPTLTIEAVPFSPWRDAELTPAVDFQATAADGVNFVVTDGGESINVARFTWPTGEDRRGVLEFDISGIPSDATIGSARLELEVRAITASPSSYPILDFHGFAGNGQRDVSDATVPFNLVGRSDPITELAIVGIDLSTDYIESLLGSATHLGLLAYQYTDGRQTSFATSEAPSFFDPPTLILEYITEIMGDVDLSGQVDDDDLSLLLAHWNQAAGWRQGDLNRDNTVNDDDLSLLLANWGAGGPPAPQPVPEPATFVLLTAGALGLMRRRRS